MVKRIDVMGVACTPMRVIFVPKNDPCPNHPNNKDHGDLIEFYDLRYDHTPDGQFISTYNLETILTSQNKSLDLYGDIDSWKIDPPTFRLIKDWIFYHMTDVFQELYRR